MQLAARQQGLGPRVLAPPDLSVNVDLWRHSLRRDFMQQLMNIPQCLAGRRNKAYR
jgi:hypothetical protein